MLEARRRERIAEIAVAIIVAATTLAASVRIRGCTRSYAQRLGVILIAVFYFFAIVAAENVPIVRIVFVRATIKVETVEVANRIAWTLIFALNFIRVGRGRLHISLEFAYRQAHNRAAVAVLHRLKAVRANGRSLRLIVAAAALWIDEAAVARHVRLRMIFVEYFVRYAFGTRHLL